LEKNDKAIIINLETKEFIKIKRDGLEFLNKASKKVLKH
jgi:hypothetical protein